MRPRLTWVMLLGAAIVATSLYARKALATPATLPPGFVSTTLALGRFGEIDVFNHFIPPNLKDDDKKNIWLSWQKTKGLSDLYVQANTWAPGADTGWHTHPGHTLVTVTAGAITHYDGDDPDCKPHVYTAGMGFVDRGGHHVHIVRNESSTQVAQVISVRLVPAGQPGRIDAPDPGNCHF